MGIERLALALDMVGVADDAPALPRRPSSFLGCPCVRSAEAAEDPAHQGAAGRRRSRPGRPTRPLTRHPAAPRSSSRHQARRWRPHHRGRRLDRQRRQRRGDRAKSGRPVQAGAGQHCAPRRARSSPRSGSRPARSRCSQPSPSGALSTRVASSGGNEFRKRSGVGGAWRAIRQAARAAPWPSFGEVRDRRYPAHHSRAC